MRHPDTSMYTKICAIMTAEILCSVFVSCCSERKGAPELANLYNLEKTCDDRQFHRSANRMHHCRLLPALLIPDQYTKHMYVVQRAKRSIAPEKLTTIK